MRSLVFAVLAVAVAIMGSGWTHEDHHRGQWPAAVFAYRIGIPAGFIVVALMALP